MAIEEKAANSRQSVDLKWKLRKALEEQVSEASDGSGIEFGKDVTVDGKLHVNDFSDIQNAKGEGLKVNMISGYISEKSGSAFKALVTVPAFTLKDSIAFEDVFKDGYLVSASGFVSGTGSVGGNQKIVVSQLLFRSPSTLYFQGYEIDSSSFSGSWGVDVSNLIISFGYKVPLAKPNPGQWDEEE